MSRPLYATAGHAIVIFGSLNINLVVQAPRLPRAGETLFGDRSVTVPGGKGANQAIAAARMGGRVAMIGCVGQDAFGDMHLANLAAAGVDASRVAAGRCLNGHRADHCRRERGEYAGVRGRR